MSGVTAWLWAHLAHKRRPFELINALKRLYTGPVIASVSMPLSRFMRSKDIFLFSRLMLFVLRDNVYKIDILFSSNHTTFIKVRVAFVYRHKLLWMLSFDEKSISKVGMYIPLSLLEASDLHRLLGGYGSNPAQYRASSRLPFGNNQTWTNQDVNQHPRELFRNCF